MQNNHPIALVILDGFGYSPHKKGNAITPENNAYIEHLFNNYPSKYLLASGEAVGLPKNISGNSQAGHLAIGTGQLILQSLTIMNKMIENKTFEKNQLLIKQLSDIKQRGGSVHIMGLASNGDVHGSIAHMLAYIKIAQQINIDRIIVHPFLDGRDTLQQEAALFLKEIDAIKTEHTLIGSIHGRFYAMDRDNNQERTMQTCSVLTQPKNPPFPSWQEALDYYYSQNLTDEYIPPTPLAFNITIQPGDLIIHTNLRPERSTQLLEYLSELKEVSIISTIEYEKPIITTPLIKNPIITKCLKMTLHNQYNLRLSTIAETEKWAHVTYFFDGYCKNRNLSHETRIHIPSIKTTSYAQIPAMSASLITKAIIYQIESKKTDFCLANYANADMVGHTGNFDATVTAIKILNHEIALLYKLIVQTMNGTMIITGDHGNAEEMLDLTQGLPSGKHTLNPVPFIVASNNKCPSIEKMESLTDIAWYIESIVKNQQ
jgi:2,3-bisphosphoglycerate-independent phosphoglycerate mutase